ncbi:MAG: hypothetical protein JWM21_5010 [Acidobacteria bacterium]|nr:hypothetical protein [Acidobacteriota bacterium]
MAASETSGFKFFARLAPPREMLFGSLLKTRSPQSHKARQANN